MTKVYYQCDLSQGSTRTHGYLEERAAIPGAQVEIKEPGFSGLWTVDAVSDRGITEEKLRADQRMNRNAFGSVAT